MHLLSVVFCVVKSCAFKLTLVRNETSNTWQPVLVKNNLRHTVRETHFFDRVRTFPPTVDPTVKDLYPRYADQRHSLEQRTLTPFTICCSGQCLYTLPTDCTDTFRLVLRRNPERLTTQDGLNVRSNNLFGDTQALND
jgi:hypothetical protein